MAILADDTELSRAKDESGERLVVAFVRGVHGLRGAVKVEVLTDVAAERFEPGHVLFREGDNRPLTIVEAAPDGPGWRLRFAEIADRDGADALRNTYLEAEVTARTTDGSPHFYWHEVVGVTVRDLDGRVLGAVSDVYRVGENEVFVVEGGPGGSFDLPAVATFIPVFDPLGEGIVVDAAALDLHEDPA